MKANRLFLKLNNQRGISAVLIAVCLVMLIGFVALSIDVSHLVVARNELQNGADAGALAGAGDLYLNDGTAINANANQIGYDAAVANQSEQIPVEVNWPGGNAGDVQRGHWSFATRTFTPNESLVAIPIWNYSEAELDADLNFINAVRVRTRRQNTLIASWFAGIFGRTGFEGFAEAVAYIGFAGNAYLEDLDFPIAICEESIYCEGEDGELELCCNVGRAINSGSKVESGETGGWTSLYQGLRDPPDCQSSDEQLDDPCSGGTNAKEVRDLVEASKLCGGSGIPTDCPVYGGGTTMATSGGEIQIAFTALRNCFLNRPIPAGEIWPKPWGMKLPVVRCPGNNITTCAPVYGVIKVKVVHITGAGEDPEYLEVPRVMDEDGLGADPDYQCTDAQMATLAGRQGCWNTFRSLYNLQNAPGSDPPQAQYAKKTIYFLPFCQKTEPGGLTGGKNYGVLAKIPVLVD